MAIFYRRPLALFCAVFISASLLGFLIDAKMKYAVTLIITIVLFITFALFVRGKISGKRLIVFIAVGISALSALLLSYLYFDVRYMPAQEYLYESREIEGVVIKRRYSNSYSSGYGIRIDNIDGEKVYYNAILDCEFVSDLQPGYRFNATVIPEELGYSDYDSMDKMYALADGYMFRCVAATDKDCIIKDENVFILSVGLKDLNSRVTSLITSAVGKEEGRLAAALSLGQKDLLSDSTIRDFRRSGVSHMLALSGMHMTILMGAVGYFLRKLSFGKSVRCVMLIGFTIFYLALTGFSVSATRAALMLMLVYLSYLFSSQSDPLTSLFSACALIIALSPASVCDAGFWMSFSAVLGIIVGLTASRGMFELIWQRKSNDNNNRSYIAPKIFIKALIWILTVIITTISASCSIAFCSWLYFGEISVLTLVTNVLMSLLATVLLAVVLLFVALSGIGEVAGILSHVIGYIAEAMINISGYFSKIENAVVSLRYAFAGIIIVALTAAYIVLFVIKLKKKWIMALPVTAAVALFTLCLGIYGAFNTDNVKVTYLKDGKNEMLLLTSLGDAVLCDMSDGSKSGIRMSLTAADMENVTEIKAFLLTHYHQKHIASTDKLLGNEVVRQIWLPEPINEREYGVMLSLIACANKHDCAVVIYERGGEITLFHDTYIKIDTAYIKRSTHPAITLFFMCGSEKFAYVGASVQESELFQNAAFNIIESNNIVFGVHGPVTKAEYAYDELSREGSSIVFADDEVLVFFRFENEDLALLNQAVLIRSPDKVTFRYNKVRADFDSAR